MAQIGIFEVDPDTIPVQPDLPEKQVITLEVSKAERNEKVNEETGKRSVWVKMQVTCPDLLGSPTAFGTLWVTEQFKGKPHKSYAQFLTTVKMPYTTVPEELKGFRFAGKVSKKQGSDFYDLAEVVGAAA